MIGVGAFTRVAKQGDVFYDLAMNAFKRARESRAEERIDDDVVAMCGNLFPDGDAFAFGESQRRGMRVRACVKARQALGDLEIGTGVIFRLFYSAEEHHVNPRAEQPESAGKRSAVAAIVAATAEYACALS